MANKKKVLPIILGIVVIAAITYGISRYIYYKNHEDTDDAQIEGNISPVLARVQGYVETILAEENMKVEEGDTLAILDRRDLEIKLQQAIAGYENALASVKVAKSNISSATSGIETAEASVENAKIRALKARSDYNRLEKLFAEKAATQQQLDNARAEKDAAEAQLRAIQSQLKASGSQSESVSQQVSVAEAIVQQRKADVDYARLQLSYAIITAPSTGYIAKKNIQPGQLVQPGQPLFSIVNDKEVWIVANFKETQLENIRPGEAVDISIDAFKNEEFKGTVHSVSAATGARFSLLPPDNATGNFVKVVQRVPVKIKLLNNAKLDKLRPGMSAKVVVDIKDQKKNG